MKIGGERYSSNHPNTRVSPNSLANERIPSEFYAYIQSSNILNKYRNSQPLSFLLFLIPVALKNAAKQRAQANSFWKSPQQHRSCESGAKGRKVSQKVCWARGVCSPVMEQKSLRPTGNEKVYPTFGNFPNDLHTFPPPKEKYCGLVFGDFFFEIRSGV